ncbi:MAG: DUF4190 domain-containing protein [Ruminococcus sp.]|nr:DUF4190 domain-containing protein [Ruminococcus sp.]
MEDYNENMNFDYNFNQPNGESHSDPNNQFYTISEGNKPIWAAVTCFVLSIVNIITCCCCWYVLAIAALILGIISLVSKWRGKGYAIAGIIISSVTLVGIVLSQMFLGDLSRGMAEMFIYAPKYYEEYTETGEIPEEFEYMGDEKYDWFWSASGFGDFATYYDMWMEEYGKAAGASADAEKPIGDEDFYTPYEETEDSTGSTDSEDAEGEFGETPVEL